MRRSTMRRVCNLSPRRCAALLALVLTACTDGGPEPEIFELAEVEPTFEAHAGFEHQPERERVVDPNSQPRLELVTRNFDPEEGICPYDVESRGFPAVDEHGTLVEVSARGLPTRDFYDGVEMVVSWLDADGIRPDRVYARDDELGGDSTCDEIIAQIRERVDAINAKLARQTWRSLERLDAFYSAAGMAYMNPEFDSADEVLASLPGADRPVEIYYGNGQLIARIRGMKVLQTEPRPQWRQTDNEFCTTDPQIYALEFDRATQVALVRYNYISGGCLCDDLEYVARIEMSAELFAAAEQRSTAEFVAAQTKLLESE